jgi:hypothetical protein
MAIVAMEMIVLYDIEIFLSRRPLGQGSDAVMSEEKDRPDHAYVLLVAFALGLLAQGDMRHVGLGAVRS